MLAPHLAEDVDIFNRHISQHDTPGQEETEPSKYQTLRHDVNDPVVYLSVPRFRTGLPPGSGCGREQLEIVEQLMGPFKREVVELVRILDDFTALKMKTDFIRQHQVFQAYTPLLPHS
jgi:hypothetical protein